MSGLIDEIAEVGSENEEEEVDEETGEERPRKRRQNGDVQDSSEEDEDDEDEEEAARIREGFIVDEDDEDDERAHRRREKKKRRRAEREEEEAALDEEDLDLIGEANPELEHRPKTQSKYKRLKRGHREDREESRAPKDIFSDDEEDVVDTRGPGQDEFADFIEEDEFEDDIQRALEEEREVARPGAKGAGLPELAGMEEAGLDEAALEDYRAAFGDGTEYDWALQKQLEVDEEEEGPDRQLELKDVFEPAQLAERMLTDEDLKIQRTDVPERYQLARKPYKPLEFEDDEKAQAYIKDEAHWMLQQLLPKKKGLGEAGERALEEAVQKVLQFMVLEDYEVPFIYLYRKDYYVWKQPRSEAINGNYDGPDEVEERLLNQNDLWLMANLDLRYRALIEKRDALQQTYHNLKSISNVQDDMFEQVISSVKLMEMEETQDLHDYLHFQYSAQLRDLTLMNTEANGTQKRAQASGGNGLHEKIRAGKVYNFVRAFGITADGFGDNLTGNARRSFTEDPGQLPEELADSLLEEPHYPTSAHVFKHGKAFFVEELVHNPKIRKFMRRNFLENGMIECHRTEKGARIIVEDHPYYEFKYLRQQSLTNLPRRPQQFLRMLKAEKEGLVTVSIRMNNTRAIKEQMYNQIESDNYSDIAEAWNELRRQAIDTALARLDRSVQKGFKENLRGECETMLASECRERFSRKLDQAPYKAKGLTIGTCPRVLALSNGRGVPNRDATCWVFLEDDGRVTDNGKFVDLRLGNKDKLIPDGPDVANFVDLVQRTKPDVITVAGFTVETRKLLREVSEIVDKHELDGLPFPDENGDHKTERIEVVLVNDEIARLYHNSARAEREYPQLPPIARYCVALGKYAQSPLKEYAALGRDIVSILVHPDQNLLPRSKLLKSLETSMVDTVNEAGVEINDAINDETYNYNLLQYVCGLGPRKAAAIVKVANQNGVDYSYREELLGGEHGNLNLIPAVGPKVWENCASFLRIDWEESDSELRYLDSTRIHPEDYVLAGKIARDAMGLDEEDEQDPNELMKEFAKSDNNEQFKDHLQDLALMDYASELEEKFKQRKRGILELIRDELMEPFEELRQAFLPLSSEELFVMLTGETRESLAEGMVVPVNVRRVFPDHVEVKLECGIEGSIGEAEYPPGVGSGGTDPRQVYQVNQTVPAKITYLNRKAFNAALSFRDKEPKKKDFNEDRLQTEWDYAQEQADRKAAEKAQEGVTGRTQRVVNHPLFKSFNSAQAEEYLGSKDPGECVIRPSSKGPDHLAVTWKVADNVYQHIDVLELDKENEFSLGKTLRVGTYNYSDLDELIVNYVQSMAKKVTEMMKDERYQKGSKNQTEQWLRTYTEANPKRSMYAFCINPKFPGYFNLCFKAGQNAPLGSWPVKVVPNAFELQRERYPDMNMLKNGFKKLFTHAQAGGTRR